MTDNAAPSKLEFNADIAETDPERDALGVKNLALAIAKGICNMTPLDGMTMAIVGPWGGGKTTMINFIRHYVEEIDPSVEQLDFNPWWFSGHEDVVRKLLQQIAKKCANDTEEGCKLVGLLCEYAEALDAVPVELKPSLLGFSVDLKKLATLSAKKFKGGRTIPDFKKEISEKLHQLGIKFLLIIDDIDRLSVTEVRDLFRAIKAVADLPNVIYLIALDREVVAKCLDEPFKNRGAQYLDKIIQVAFDLPKPSDDGISRIFASGIEKLLDVALDGKIDSVRFWALYRSGLRQMLKTPRDVVRLLNALYVSLPAVAAEVNIPDFIAMEAVRLFRAGLYSRIRSNKEMFAGEVRDGMLGQPQNDELNQFHAETISKEETWQKEFLMDLFPKLKRTWQNISYTSVHLTEWRRERRVCSRDMFDVYFSFAIPTDQISSAEVAAFLQSANSGSCKMLVLPLAESASADDKNRLWSLIERIEDHIDDAVTELGYRTLFLDLLEVWNQYRTVEGTKDRSLVGIGNDLSLVRILFQCFKRLPPNQQYDVLKTSIENHWSIDILCRLVGNIGLGYTKFSGGRQPEPDMAIMCEEHYREVANLLCKAIQEQFDDEEIDDRVAVGRKLNLIAQVSPERVGLAVDRLKKSTKGVLGLLSYGSTTESITLGKGTIKYSFDFDRLSRLINIEELASLVRTVPGSVITEFGQHARELVACFVNAFERWEANEPLPGSFESDDD